MKQKHLVVIGGGAAGFFCAVNAARVNPALKVTVVEKSNKLLAKVKVSGGGRCNTTHACFDIPELTRKYPRGQNFMKKTLHWFNPTHTIEWFEERGRFTERRKTTVACFPLPTIPRPSSSACLKKQVNTVWK
jgi:predicted flavoprotein YhiN